MTKDKKHNKFNH